jgi:hypothetical protein
MTRELPHPAGLCAPLFLAEFLSFCRLACTGCRTSHAARRCLCSAFCCLTLFGRTSRSSTACRAATLCCVIVAVVAAGLARRRCCPARFALRARSVSAILVLFVCFVIDLVSSILLGERIPVEKTVMSEQASRKKSCKHAREPTPPSKSVSRHILSRASHAVRADRA